MSANSDLVVVGSRNLLDDQDVFTCLRIADGSEVWKFSYPAIGTLDYGNSPRATPLIVEDKVVLLGAFGDLTVLELETGTIVWQLNFGIEFDAEVPTWGFCGSPLLVTRVVDGTNQNMIVVQPGAEEAALVAVELESGEVIWQSPDGGTGYSSCILATVNNTQQIIGYGSRSLIGWDTDGNRRWEIEPKFDGDFNVPTPIMIGERLFVTTENNGSRLYAFDSDGKLIPTPISTCDELAPDTHSPVLVGDLICGTTAGLVCLAQSDLKVVHRADNECFQEYTSMISDGKSRLLSVSIRGEIVLVDLEHGKLRISDPLQALEEVEVFAHPALANGRLIVRYGAKLACINLNQ